VGRVLTVTNSNSNDLGVRKKTIGREIVIGPNAIKFVAIAIFAILAMVYLAQSTAGANRSVKISDYESQKSQLELQKEQLEVEQTRLQSLKEIDGSTSVPADGVAAQNTMVPSGSVEHLSSGSVAN
jgi:hypothetical protein